MRPMCWTACVEIMESVGAGRFEIFPKGLYAGQACMPGTAGFLAAITRASGGFRFATRRRRRDAKRVKRKVFDGDWECGDEQNAAE